MVSFGDSTQSPPRSKEEIFFFDRIREACSIVFVRMHSAHKIFVKHQGGERMAGGHTTNTRT